MELRQNIAAALGLIGLISAIQLGRFVFLEGGSYFLLYKRAPQIFSSRRVHFEKLGSDQMIREISFGLSTIIIFATIYASFLNPFVLPLTKIYFGTQNHGWARVALELIALVLFNDTYFYWMHRAIHHPRLFGQVHRVHHLSLHVSPFTSYSFHPIESLLELGWIVPLVFIFPMSIISVFALATVLFLNNYICHVGVRVPLPSGFNDSKTHGDHHESFDCNYGLYFHFWDKVCGTYRE